MENVKCPICGTLIDDDSYTDCPYCGWGYTGAEEAFEDDEREPWNLMSKGEAKELLKKGLNVWGEPLPKKL